MTALSLPLGLEILQLHRLHKVITEAPEVLVGALVEVEALVP
jgi:hypothetical protein